MMKMLLLLFLSVSSCCLDLTSPFSPDGAPLTELSWSTSLVVVGVSFSGLFTFVLLMLACLCCRRRRRIRFKEFKNVDSGDMSTMASPASGNGDVYVLPLTEVSLPLAVQPAPSVQLLQPTDLGRRNLFYLKEIGNGWFGKVLLGEINPGLTSTQVVVKELKTSASVHEQMHFLEEARPFRTLQHPALLQCLVQCTEVSPYLLVMEFCPLGDVKGYLRGCRRGEVVTPEPLVLQQMACDITAGLLHLHKHGFTHSDLALRNCLLTSDHSVKIGDYGLSQTKYKEDYYLTSDQSYVPLRWIAPELVDEVHGNLLVSEHTPQSNIWSLGVTIWELFEFGNQPYRNYTDRQVLAYTVKEQQLRLKIPLLRVPLAERWYEVMQFCWLQPEQRPTAEEVHLLLTYLCAKGASEAEEDFERRWNSMCPNTGHHRPSALSQDHPSLSSSSFPLLEQFSAGDGYHSGDDVLTVTETSQGLNFEYKWEQARAQQICRPPESSCSLGQVDHRCPDTFYPPGGIMGSCALESLSHGVSSSYYEPKHLHAPGVLPVLSAHSPSVNSEYYIRIEEPVGCPMDPDYTIGSYSPEYQGSSGSFLTGSADSGECVSCPSLPTTNMGSYWSAEIHRSEIYDSSDSSPAISLTMEPLLGHVTHNSPLRAWESSHYVSYKDRDGGYYFENSPPLAVDPYLMGDEQSSIEHLQESWGSRSLRQALGELEHPLGLMPSVGSPPDLAYRDPYLDTGQTSIIGKNLTGGYYDMMGSLRKTMPSHTRHNSHSVSINMETEGALYIGHRDSESEEEDVEDVFVERHTCNTWPSKHHHSRKGQHRRTSHSCRQDTYVDFHYTMPSTDIEDSWPKDHSLVYHSLPRPIHYPEPRHAKDNSACLNLSKHSSMPSSENFPTYIYLCHEDEPPAPPPGQCCHSHFVDPLAGLLVRNSSYTQSKPVKDKMVDVPSGDEMINLSPAPGGPHVPKTTVIKTDEYGEQYIDLGPASTRFRETKEDIIKENPIMQKPPEPKVEDVTLTMNKMIAPPAENVQVMMVLVDPQSEVSQTGDSGLGQDSSSTGLVDILDCSDDEEDEDITEDITDVTSGIFVDDSSELNASPALKSLQKQVGTPDSMDSIDLPPGVCEGFSPGSSHPSSSPKALDSGYNTENNQSPEFVLKEPHETTEDSQGAPTPDPGHQGPHEEPQEEQKEEKEDQPEVVSEEEQREKVEEEEQKKENNQEEEEEEDKLGVDATVLSHSSLSLDEDVSQTGDHIFLPLSDKTPYRDSAYFSDYENERVLKDEGAEEQSEVTEEQIKEPEGEQMNNKNEEKSEEPSAAGTEEAEDEEGSKFAQTASPIEEEDDWPSQEETSSLGDWAAEVVVAMEEALGALNEGGSLSSEVEKKKEGGARAESSKTSAPTKETVSRSSHHRTSAETLHALPKDEVALQHSANARRFSSSSSTPPSTPPPPLGVTDGQGPSANGEEWNEEQRANSDDSDDSDEELQSYAVQEESEDDEECHLVPIVVSDDSHVHTLRSLLKTPTTLVADSQEEALKKTVSFFDDVTVYLFDQESPTQELTENCFLLETEGQRSENSSKEKLNTSDDSSDGNVSEESAGYEWEDDFSLLPLPTSAVTSDSPPKNVMVDPPHRAPVAKQETKMSRFTVSRFSITHVSDSDVESVGGSSEDGDKEE